MAPDDSERAFLDAGVLIGALLEDDPRHEEAFAVVGQARLGHVLAQLPQSGPGKSRGLFLLSVGRWLCSSAWHGV
jgi:hypothetical protein